MTLQTPPLLPLKAGAVEPADEPVGWRYRLGESCGWLLCSLETAPKREFAFEWEFVYRRAALEDQACAPRDVIGAADVASPWIPVSERLPGLGPSAFVLATYLTGYGKPRVVRAYFAPKHTIESTGDSDEFADYSEEDDCYYVPEGWYECNAHEETNWLIDEVVTHWMPLPEAPKP